MLSLATVLGPGGLPVLPGLPTLLSAGEAGAGVHLVSPGHLPAEKYFHT